jgi:GNAT superfamily N-acetyltransferase
MPANRMLLTGLRGDMERLPDRSSVMLWAMEFGVDGAWGAWSRLAGLSMMDGLQVVVDPECPLGPRGWIAILAVGSNIAASVPWTDLKDPVTAALTGLTADEATTPDVVAPRLPPARSTLGPAALFYPPPGFTPARGDIDEASRQEVAGLCAAVDPSDLDESGLAHVESPAFVSRASDGAVAAACGYRAWPNGVAHLSALTHPDHRREGHGRRAANAAVRHAIEHDLLPQWRARPISSQRLALGLGLVRTGAQLSLHPA